MKILYAAGNRSGAGIQLLRFLRHAEKHDIRVAAYMKSSQHLSHIDWTLDGANHKFASRNVADLSAIFDKGKFPHICVEAAELLMADIHQFDPDLVISDGENIMANIAWHEGYRLWYVSPLHLINGVKWDRGVMKYKSILTAHKRVLERLPPAEKTFVYSPLCNVDGIQLKPGFEWIKPYYHDIDLAFSESNVAIIRDDSRVSALSKILNCIHPYDIRLFSKYYYDLPNIECVNIKELDEYKQLLSACRWLFCTGETSYLADALYAGIPNICVSPSMDDPEALINSIFLESFQAGDNVGQVEKMGKFAVEVVEKSITKKRFFNMNDNKVMTLDERISQCTDFYA